MAYPNEGTLVTDEREIAISETWDSQTDWEAYQSLTDVVISNGVVMLEEGAIPDSGVFRLTLDNDDTSSGTAIDVWNGNDATITGATTGVSGANQTYNTNEAYDFDGTDDYLTGDDTGFPSGDQPRSFAAWVNPDTLPNGAYIFSYGSAATNEAWCLDGGDTYRVVGFGNDWDTGVAPTTDVWQHVAVTYDGSEVAFFVDGTQQNSTTSFSYNTTLSDYHIGAFVDSSETYDGSIDDPRFYDKGLSDTEVSNLYNNGSI